jgi:hypothetical protein
LAGMNGEGGEIWLRFGHYNLLLVIESFSNDEQVLRFFRSGGRIFPKKQNGPNPFGPGPLDFKIGCA